MAAARGIPLVTVASAVCCPNVPAARSSTRSTAVAGRGARRPVVGDVYGQLYLHPFPVSFGQRPDSTVVRPIRPDRGPPSVAPAAWVASLGVDRPFVYVTAGPSPLRSRFRGASFRSVGRHRRRRCRHHRATRRPGDARCRTGQCARRALRPARRSARAGQRSRLPRRRRHGPRRCLTGPAATGRAVVRRPVGERCRVDDAGCGIVLGRPPRHRRTSSRRCVRCSPTRHTVRPPLGSPTRSPRCRPRPIWHRDRGPRRDATGDRDPRSPSETHAPVTDDGRDMLRDSHVAEVARLLPGYVARIDWPVARLRQERTLALRHCWQ